MKKLTLLSGIIALFFTTSCRDVVNSVLDILPPFEVPFNTMIDVPFAAISTTSYTRTSEIFFENFKQNLPEFILRMCIIFLHF